MNEQLALRFGGATYDHDRDRQRLGKQLRAVIDLMVSMRGYWVTLAALSVHVRAPEASVSARLRDMRKLGFQVERRYVANGLHEYRLN